MFCTLLFIGVSLVFGAFGQSQICVSDPVANLTVSPRAELIWAEPTNCNVSFYVIQIIGKDNVTYHYESTTRIFNVSFLPYCETFQFRVTPVSELNVQGEPISIRSQVLPGSDENITISSFNVTPSHRTHALVEWKMPDGVQNCFNLYRVVIWDADRHIPHDVYTLDNKFNFSDAVPCMNYEFGIRPIFNPEEDGPLTLFNYSYPGATTTPPTLASITEGVTSINMTWLIESYDENRCNVTAINIDASPNFNVSHPVEDSPSRPAVAFELLNLQPNTVYVSRVSVINSEGMSESIVMPLQTLPNVTSWN